MTYQPWLEERIERYRAFYADDSPGQILVNIALWDMEIDYSRFGLDSRPLNAWDFEAEAEAFAEQRVRHVRADAELSRWVGDDWVPFVTPGIGIALNSIYYSGAPMIPGEATTWVHPVIHSWDDLGRLKADPQNPWCQVIQRISRRYVEMNEGDYAVQSYAHFAPMDMANALRGNTLFTDFYDAPEQVHALMGCCVQAIVWLEEEQRRIVPDVMGGTAIWGTWVPGHALFMSEDATDLCSAGIYTEFGRPYTEQVAHSVGSCWIHHHARGLHVHREIARVWGLQQVEISLDPNCERPIDHLPELFEWNDGLPLMTRCFPQDVYSKIDEMKQGRLVLMLSASSLEEAREAVAFVRRHARN